MENRQTVALLWVLIVIYAIARILQVFADSVPMIAIVILHVIPPGVFALIHGAMRYGWRGILIFTLLCLAVGNLFENMSILTGFPFGHYYFTELMGPKLLNVPILLGLAYVGMGYLSWTLGSIILGSNLRPISGLKLVALPLTASFIMVAWDLSMDPVWATLEHGWIWLQGGSYFGVPVSNFLGWYLTVYVIYQVFALVQRERVTNVAPLTPAYWYLAIMFYGLSAAGNLLVAIPRSGLSVIDPSGVRWKVSDITAVCALVTVFIMGAFTVIAAARVAEE